MLAFSSDSDETLVPLARRCEELGLEVSLVPRLFESVNDRFQYESLGGLPLLALRSTDPKGWQFAVKHAFDRVVAAVLLTLFSPLLALIALAVRIESPGPIVFRQRRVGRDGHEFDVFKFRSMHMSRAGGASSRRAAARRRAASRAPTAARGSGGSCAARRSTSCRSCSTSCAAT